MTTNEVRGLNAFHLARLADCASPDNDSSPGAAFLLRVADDVAELMAAGDWDDDDSPHEVADTCVPIYTHNVWRTFTDLAAWQEDPTEMGADASDMEQAARVCLYMIGERLARALAEEWADDESDEEESRRVVPIPSVKEMFDALPPGDRMRIAREVAFLVAYTGVKGVMPLVGLPEFPDEDQP